VLKWLDVDARVIRPDCFVIY